MKDSNGKLVKNGDQIKTTRGVVLDIVEIEGILYMRNSGNGRKSPLSIIDIDFYILEDD